MLVFSRFMVWMLVMASMGSAAHAQVVLNMPPRPKQPQTVVASSSESANTTVAGHPQAQTLVQPYDPARVGNVALLRYARARARPRPGYGFRGRYGYYDPYYYGYYPFQFGFGFFSFGHHSHHHHDTGMGGGGH